MGPFCHDCKHLDNSAAAGFMPLCTAPQLKVTMQVRATYAHTVRETGALCGHVGRWYQPKEKE